MSLRVIFIMVSDVKYVMKIMRLFCCQVFNIHKKDKKAVSSDIQKNQSHLETELSADVGVSTFCAMHTDSIFLVF